MLHIVLIRQANDLLLKSEAILKKKRRIKICTLFQLIFPEYFNLLKIISLNDKPHYRLIAEGQ